MSNYDNGAVLSPCEMYRYALWRTLDEPEGDKVFGYIGVNPSTADHTVDDATVRKWRGFTKVNGGCKFVVGNLFAYRSTDVKGLQSAEDSIGPDCDEWLDTMLDRCDIIVPCWGNSSKIPKDMRYRVSQVTGKILSKDKPVMCLGTTKSGDPKHPLMLSYKTQLEIWRG